MVIKNYEYLWVFVVNSRQFVLRFFLLLRVALLSVITVLAGHEVSLITALACNPGTIPFCRKSVALYRKGGLHRKTGIGSSGQDCET